MLRITLVKSPIGRPEKERLVLESLGLKKIRESVSHPDTPVFRGMIHKVTHLVRVAEE